MRVVLRATPVMSALILAGCLGATTQSSAPVDQLAPGTWASFAPLPTARQEVAVATLHGQVWVIGGFGATAEPTATAEHYDPATNTWTARPSLPVAVHHAAAVTVGDRLFGLRGYPGGRVRWGPVGDLWEWNGARGAGGSRAPMRTPRGALAAPAATGGIPRVRCAP